jgi:hypothetical protein
MIKSQLFTRIGELGGVRFRLCCASQPFASFRINPKGTTPNGQEAKDTGRFVHDTLKDIYFAEKKAVQHPQLNVAFEHLKEPRGPCAAPRA